MGDVSIGIAAIKDAKFENGVRLTGNALNLARSQLTTGRPGVQKTVLLITVGQPTQMEPARKAAQKLRAAGARFMAVYAGDNEKVKNKIANKLVKKSKREN